MFYFENLESKHFNFLNFFLFFSAETINGIQAKSTHSHTFGHCKSILREIVVF